MVDQLDFSVESILEEANLFHFDNLGISHQNFDDLFPIDRVGNLTCPPVIQNGFEFNDFHSLSSMSDPCRSTTMIILKMGMIEFN